jgi:hypothetical protein
MEGCAWWGGGGSVFKDRTNVCDVRMKLEEYVMCQVKKNKGTAADSKSWLLVSHLLIYLLSVYLRLFKDSISSSDYIPPKSLAE